MKYLSVCSGIEAATVAWHELGWEPIAFAEVDKFPSRVLAHHYPDVPNLGDMTKFKEWPDATFDVLVGGTPCQSFSVAGLRKGMDDPRGNLALTYLAIADRYRPQWIVWENVPGVLSSNGGRDFGSFVGALGKLGYGWAYRVLDAQYFGVAQRRRRVFVVGCLGDWRAAAAVLFEQSCLSRHPAPSREAREGAAIFTPGSIGSYREGCGTLRANGGDLGGGSEGLVAHHVVGALTARGPDGMGAAQVDAQHYIPTWRDGGDCGDNAAHAAVAFHPTQDPISSTEVCHSISSGNGQGCATAAVAFNAYQRTEQCVTWPLGACDGRKVEVGVRSAMAVRRLTPVKCERLQGFPDGYTAIPWRGKTASECPDGPRYRALGNSMAVPCMRWIGERIAQVHAMPSPM